MASMTIYDDSHNNDGTRGVVHFDFPCLHITMPLLTAYDILLDIFLHDYDKKYKIDDTITVSTGFDCMIVTVLMTVITTVSLGEIDDVSDWINRLSPYVTGKVK